MKRVNYLSCIEGKGRCERYLVYFQIWRSNYFSNINFFCVCILLIVLSFQGHISRAYFFQRGKKSFKVHAKKIHIELSHTVLPSPLKIQNCTTPNECVWRFGVSFTYVIESIDSKSNSVCLINDYSLIADLHIFVYGSAECATISL